MMIALLFPISWSFLGCHGQFVPMNATMPAYMNYKTWSGLADVSATLTVIKVPTSLMYSGLNPMGPVAILSQRLALEKLKTLTNWLPAYELEFDLIDDQSDDPVEIGVLLERMRYYEDENGNNVLPIFAMMEYASAGQLSVLDILKNYNFMGVNIYPMPQPFRNKARYPNYMPFGEPQDYFAPVAVDFVKKMGWKRVAVVSDTNSYSNMMDSVILDQLEAANISLVYFAKFQENSEDDYELDSLFGEMEAKGPRIVIQNYGRSSISAVCYLHKHGFHGPNYVLMSYAWSAFDENSFIPESMASWCSKKMLLEVLDGAIFYADAPLAEIYGPDIKDSMGMTKDGYLEYVRSRVDGISLAVAYEYFAPPFYDRCVILGYLLNETETILNQELNSTLSECTVNSDNFWRNSSYFLQTLKRAASKIELVGIKGDWSWSLQKDLPSGSMPIVFTQSRNNGENSSSTFIGYYKSNLQGEKLVLHQENIKWRTSDGNPPKDRLVIKLIHVPLLPHYVTVVFMSLASCFVCAIVVVLILLAKKRFLSLMPASNADFCLLIGDLVLICQTFATPFGVISNPGLNCSVMFSLISSGITIVLTSLIVKFENNVREFERSFLRRSTVVILNLWMILSPVLFIAAIMDNPIKSGSISLGIEISMKDAGVAYQSLRAECLITETFLHSSQRTFILVCISAAFLVLMLFRLTYLAFRLRSLLKTRIYGNVNPLVITDLMRGCVSISCILTIVAAAFFIGIIIGTSNRSITLLLTAVCFAIVTTNVLVIFANIVTKPSPTRQNSVFLPISMSSRMVDTSLRVPSRRDTRLSIS